MEGTSAGATRPETRSSDPRLHELYNLHARRRSVSCFFVRKDLDAIMLP